MAVRASAPPPTESAPPGRVQVPKVVTDPVWSLRPWPVSVTLAGHLVEIPAMVAADWLAVLMTPQFDPNDMFPGLLSDAEQSLIYDALLDGGIGLEEFEQTCTGILDSVCGRPWWVGMRLIEVVRTNWEVIGGEMILKGVDAQRLSLSAWLDAALLTVLKHIDPKDATMFTLKLEAPPVSVAADQVQEMTMDAAAFAALAS